MRLDATPLRVALLDLYAGHPNLGMEALRSSVVAASGRYAEGTMLRHTTVDTRGSGDLPDLDAFDLFVSSGGPGSPFDGEGQAWEKRYFTWLEDLYEHNARTADPSQRKHALFVCHSFQLMVRFFEVARVTQRKSESFGVFPVTLTAQGEHDPLFANLSGMIYAADFRHWQAVEADARRCADLGVERLALEKARPHVPLERAIMALRITPEIVGVQFHPEADPDGMLYHFQQPERRNKLVGHHGVEKYNRFLKRLRQPEYLLRTHRRVLPNFYRHAAEALRGQVGLRRAA